MIVWEMFLIPVSLAVTAMSSICTPQLLDEPPDKITVLRGSSLTLFCSGTSCQGGTRSNRVMLNWRFSANDSESSNEERTFTCNNRLSEEKMWCNYTIINVQDKDSGWYYCKLILDRPILMHIYSSGTRIVVGNEMDALVTANPVTRTPGIKDVIQSKTFLIVSGVSALLLLIMLAVMICVVQRRRRRHQEMTNPIYANTRPPLATRRKQTSKPDPLVASRVPPKAQTPLKAKCRDVS